MGTSQHPRGKNKPPHHGGGDEARKQHAPSRHGESHGEPEHKRGSHREEPAPERTPESETDWPAPGRSPSEELSDDDRD